MLRRLRRWIAQHLRYSADVIDPSSGPRCTGMYLRIVDGKGALLDDGMTPETRRGQLLWVMQEDGDNAMWAER
jgi:hypothetical protein